MNTTEASSKTRLKVGIFTLLGLLMIGIVTVEVNDKPYWWRPCQLVRIQVDDATGLKTKSPIRSLGLEIGYLANVELSETHVTLGICITAPIDILPSTRAYIRGEGFLGDKFVELKPVKYLNSRSASSATQPETPAAPAPGAPTAAPTSAQSSQSKKSLEIPFGGQLADFFIPSAQADDNPAPAASTTSVTAPPTAGDDESAKGREIPVGAESQDVQQLVGRVDKLVKEMTGLTTNLKQSINPEELHETMRQLNEALQNASRTLSPQGGLNQTAQRTLAKLEDAVEQIRDQFTRINQGQGSIGKLLNDPSYAEELHQVLQNANRLLSKVAEVRFVVDIGAEEVSAISGSRAWLNLQIFPTPTYYYMLGIASDPRGKRTAETDTVVAGNTTTVTQVTKIEQTGILLTGMIGKIFNRYLEGAVGALYGDGAVSIKLRLGPPGLENSLFIQNDIYSHSGDTGINDRITVQIQPYKVLYLRAGIEGVNSVNGSTPLFAGGGLIFDDENIKLLFALR
jgi:phospholipid/cholesterol/gamma-HCH transport system substrate-binding protein